MKRIVIVGGGAAGLELATRLGRSLGKPGLAEITLIDPNRVHLWKPLLHEVASGSLDTGREALSYRAHSSENGYYFRMGTLQSLDRAEQSITLAPLLDHHQKEILHERVIAYDYLVLAVGARSNDFGLAGIREHCFTLDTANEAEDFHLTFLNRFLKYSEETSLSSYESPDDDPPASEPVRIAIVGAGATGVELAAELYNAVDRLEHFGIQNIHHQSLSITLIEAFDRILPALPDALADKARHTLETQGVNILTGVQVTAVESSKLQTSQGVIEADMLVWAAGVKAPEFLSHLGLSTNRIHQIEVNDTLLAKGETNIFAIGDCASLIPEHNEHPIPPTAQAAHQMAELCYKNICAIIHGEALARFEYHDHGALVSLSHFQTVGRLLDSFFHKPWMVEGKLAHWAYISLYRQHQSVLHSRWRMFWILLGSFIEKRVKPKLKLY